MGIADGWFWSEDIVLTSKISFNKDQPLEADSKTLSCSTIVFTSSMVTYVIVWLAVNLLQQIIVSKTDFINCVYFILEIETRYLKKFLLL